MFRWLQRAFQITWAGIDAIIERLNIMQSAIDEMRAEVARLAAEVNRVAEQLEQAADDPKEVRELTAQIKAAADKLTNIGNSQ